MIYATRYAAEAYPTKDRKIRQKERTPSGLRTAANRLSELPMHAF